MTDFQAFNATSYQIIRLEDDYNHILHHAFEKTAKYVVRKNSSYYDAIQGGTSTGAGTIAFGGESNAGAVDGTSFHDVLEAAITSGAGGRVHLRGGDFALDDTIDVGQSNTWISGEGPDTIITQATADKHGFSFATKSTCRLSSLTLIGTGAGTGCGVYATTTSANLMIDHVKCTTWGYHGIHIVSSNYVTLWNNWCVTNLRHGCLLDTVDNSKVLHNIFTSNTRHGVELDDSTGNLIQGNHITNNDFDDTATYDGIYIGHSSDSSDYNLIHGNKISDNDRYELNIGTASCTGNQIGVNMLYGTDREAICNNAGTNTRFRTFPLQLLGGTTLLTTMAAGMGYEIDANLEQATWSSQLPLDVQQVMQLRLGANSLVAEADAMRLEVVGQGGGDNEGVAAEAIAVVDKASASTNFAVNDYLYWLLTASDDADIDDLVGGDHLQIQVLHEAAGGADCATDAVFYSCLVEYV